ncbi:MAG: hypothetical protein FJ045_05680 [Crenarchaeota archaeon]|nr:hypothetical protein [Thermoproteota archaeon]
MRLAETKEGTVIEVFVKPNQPKFNIKIDGDEIVIFCTEEPVKGRVNKELVKELSRLFHARVEIVSGVISRQKRLLIVSTGKSTVAHFLRVR